MDDFLKKRMTKLAGSAEKSGLSDMHGDSSPSFGTRKIAFSSQIHDFLTDSHEVWQQPVAEKYPFKLARLIHHRYNMRKRWYILFYAWDVSTDSLKRYRMFEPLNRIKEKYKRIDQANDLVRIINAQLRAGKVLGKDKLEGSISVVQPSKLSLLKAIEHVELQKKLNGHRLHYYRGFKTLRNNLAAWLEFKKVPEFPLKDFDDKDAREFFHYLRDERGLANKTINTAMSNLAIAFKFIEKESGTTLFKKDPFRSIEILPVIATMNPAYSDDQIKKIKKEIASSIKSAPKNRKPGYRQLELFISFIYYTLARPKEISLLKVGDIDMKECSVLIKGENSKTKFDAKVELAPSLQKIILKSGILKYQHDDYIFSANGLPGVNPLHENFFWDKHKRVLKRTGLLEINSKFSLYSYKHSGAISLYKATKDIKLVQRQCRHRNLDQTNAYLRDLGKLSDFNQLKGYKGAI